MKLNLLQRLKYWSSFRMLRNNRTLLPQSENIGRINWVRLIAKYYVQQQKIYLLSPLCLLKKT